MDTVEVILRSAGIGSCSSALVWMWVRSTGSEDPTCKGLIDWTFFGGCFAILSSICDAFRSCFRRPSRENAPELMAFAGVALIASSFAVG